jgi:predicted transposase/invertase (TIGR01784 family)
MSYDNTCKFLAENFPTDFASWLLGEAIVLTKMEPTELSSEPIRSDTVILLQAKHVILHIEFQTETDVNIPFRMVDYWVRLRRKHPDKKIHQTVIYLKRTNLELASQTTYSSDQLTHIFNVIRLWEQPTETFQKYLGLLPLAVLTKTDDPTETLREVAKLIDNIEDRKIKSNLTASTGIISGLALSKDIIDLLLRSDLMQESVIYQDILLKGEIKGKAEGKAEGKLEERTQIALNMLHSGISIDLIAQITGLSLEQIQKL